MLFLPLKRHVSVCGYKPLRVTESDGFGAEFACIVCRGGSETDYSKQSAR